MHTSSLHLVGLGSLLSLLVTAGCGLPGGPGNFDRPAKATKMSGSLVRYYDACATPNATSGTGTAACAPPSAPSTYRFGPKGACSVKAGAVHQKVCPGDPSVACNDVKIGLKCSDVRDAGDTPIAAGGSGWQMRVIYRATIADAAGDMTLSDAPITFDLTTDTGKVLLNDTPIFAAVTAVQSMLAAEYVGPLNAQIIDATILDPAGKIFAVLGLSSGAD